MIILLCIVFRFGCAGSQSQAAAEKSAQREGKVNDVAVEMLVGLNVIDDEAYQLYRDEMTPILMSYGGGFGYDFKISEVLKSKTEARINRVFTIYFSNEDSMNSFFSNEAYLKIKKRHFEKSVTDTTIIATYGR